MTDEMEEMRALVRAMLTPLRRQPMRLFVHAFTGCKVLEMNRSPELLDALKASFQAAARAINSQGLYSRRVNEAGNKIEPFVREALIAAGFHADVPENRDGRRQTAGYPDLFVRGHDRLACPPFYLECKTFNPANADSGLRSFYLSPPLSKVNHDAAHLLLAFRMAPGAESERKDGMARYEAREWKLLDLFDLKVDVKHEIQASNRDMYGALPPLLEGSVS